ncbi:nuclear transport factor 2 family protein [Kribbella swartbergensis]
MKVLIGSSAMLLVAACGQTTPSTGGPMADSPTVSGRTLTTSGPTTGTTSPVGVLPAAQAYVDAVARRDLDGLVKAFHADGRIVDVSRTIAGHDSIRTWADNEVIGGTLRVIEVVEQRPDGQKLLVHWAPAGSDGWRAHYDFTVRDDRISVANLQYA